MVKITKRKVATYVIVVLFVFWCVFPIYSVLAFSFMRDREMLETPTHWIPQEPSLENYGLMTGVISLERVDPTKHLGQVGAFRDSMFRSVFVAGLTTLIAILVSSGAAYAFARFRFKAKNGWLIGLLMSRMLPTASLIIPYFILFKEFNLIGTYQGLIITYLGFTIPFATWVLIGYFSALPIETERAARIDGCSRLGTLFRVILPMARSGIVSVAVIIFLLIWGELLFALILSTGSSVALFAPVLTSFAQVLGGVVSPTLLATATVLGLIPIFIIATVFQRYITRLKIVDPVTVTEEKPFM